MRLLGNDALANHVVKGKSDRLSLAQETVLFHLRQAYQRNMHQYNLRSTDRQLIIGQRVHVRNFSQSNAGLRYSAKLAKKFLPAKVKRRVGTVAYELEDDAGKILGTFHAKDIRV